MHLKFDLLALNGSKQSISTDIHQMVIAGWAGRDHAAIEHHIEELAAIGVPRPSSVPLFYRVASQTLSQASTIEVVGQESSGEVEVFVFTHQGELLVSLTSDHTDRGLETVSVALSKQVCTKPVGSEAWRFQDVAAHWDQLMIESYITEDGKRVQYQSGPLSALLHPMDLIARYVKSEKLPAGVAMSCGTVGTQGAIRPAARFEMSLIDPVLNRSLTHRYDIETLPKVS
ncbi:DUF2848 domain-containing protein [Zwartia sp.]|uniref:DUF2848 domain-containing protein n=1 Tax=Zwartia sp. TaxID=2978004 RepID=UPI003BB0EA5C